MAGATPHEFYRTIDGVVYDSIKEAAQVLHLIRNDNFYAELFHEMSRMISEDRLRRLFVMLLQQKAVDDIHSLKMVLFSIMDFTP